MQNFIKVFFSVLIIFFFFLRANGQQLSISANGGATELFLKNGYTFNNWGVAGGLGISYTLKDTLIGIEVQGLEQSITDKHYNGNAIYVPLFLRLNPRNVNGFHLQVGPYFESLIADDFNLTWKKQDYGAALGINYIKAISKKLSLGANVEFFYGLNKPVEENEPVGIAAGIPVLTGVYTKDYFNMQSFILNVQVIYRLK